MKWTYTTTRMTAGQLLKEKQLWCAVNELPGLYPESFFVTPDNIQSWLSALEPEKELVVSTAELENQTVIGLVICGVVKRKVARIFNMSGLSLMRTGLEGDDQWWPEYVMPICHPDVMPYWSEWMGSIIKQTKSSFLITEVVPEAWLDDWSSNSPLGLIVENRESGGVIDLRGELSYPKSIRRQCAQTERAALSSGGELVLVKEDVADAWDVVSMCSHWHIAKWAETETPSGFLNEKFVRIVKSWVERAQADVFSVRQNGEVLGFTLVLKQGGWRGFYLASLKSFEGNHWHLGTWMHVSIAKYYQGEGARFYDFMAGTARYKERLVSNSGYDRSYARGVWFRRAFFSESVIKYLF